MKTEISWAFIGLFAAFGLAGAALVAAPEYAAFATFAFVLLGWVISLCLHEYGHAATASAFGDTTIVERGYLTLNPVHYFSGVGSLILPVIALIVGGIALPGGAVLIRTDLIRQKWQQSLVSLAGPAMSLVSALVCYWVAQAVSGTPLLHDGLMLLTFFLMMAFVLNILPIPGLDGFGALRPYLPRALTSAVPPQIGGLVIVAALLGVFFFGYRIIMPLVMGAAALIGMDINLGQIGDAMDRFQFWR